MTNSQDKYPFVNGNRLRGDVSVLAVGFFVLLGFCVFRFSCKEHILIDQIRKSPNLANNQDFQRAIQDSPQHEGNGNTKALFLSILKRHVSGWVYYPSFSNALMLVIIADLVCGGYTFRYLYFVAILALTSIHQVSKTRQTFSVLKDIKYEE